MSGKVSTTVWNWREAGGPQPAPRIVGRVIVHSLVLAALAAAVALLLHHRVVGLAIGGLALVLLVLGLVAPRAWLAFQNVGGRLGRAVGTSLAWLLLTPVFYLVFFPVSLVLRLQRRDPLHRAPRPAGVTYWIPRLVRPTAESYRRQFLVGSREARRRHRPVGDTGPDGAAS